MAKLPDQNNRWLPVVFSASFVLQMLSALACFLAAVVLPQTDPTFGRFSVQLLMVLGCLFLLAAGINLFWGRRLAQWTHWLGRRSRFVLPREGIVWLLMMLVLAVGGILGQSHGNRLLIVFGIMAGMFIFNGWCVMAMLARVSVRRTLPDSVAAGEVFRVEIQAENRKPLISSRLLRVSDTVHHQEDGGGPGTEAEPAVTFVRIGPHLTQTGSYQLMLNRRGLYHFGPLRLSSRFPLGIGERARSVADSATLLVHPRIGRLRPGWKQEQRLAESLSTARARTGLHDDEFHQIRDFREGDNPRFIHWRSTARRGRLMLREFEQQRESVSIVLLDLFQCPEFPEPLQELAISLAATLCLDQIRSSSVGTHSLAIAGRENAEIRMQSSMRFQQAALDALAMATTHPRADLAGILPSALESLERGSRLVLITPRPEAARVLADAVFDELSYRGVWLQEQLRIVAATPDGLSGILDLTDDDGRALPDTEQQRGSSTTSFRKSSSTVAGSQPASQHTGGAGR